MGRPFALLVVVVVAALSGCVEDDPGPEMVADPDGDEAPDVIRLKDCEGYFIAFAADDAWASGLVPRDYEETPFLGLDALAALDISILICNDHLIGESDPLGPVKIAKVEVGLANTTSVYDIWAYLADITVDGSPALTSALSSRSDRVSEGTIVEQASPTGPGYVVEGDGKYAVTGIKPASQWTTSDQDRTYVMERGIFVTHFSYDYDTFLHPVVLEVSSGVMEGAAPGPGWTGIGNVRQGSMHLIEMKA